MTKGWLRRSMLEASEDVEKLPAWAVRLAMAMDPVAPLRYDAPEHEHVRSPERMRSR